MLGLALARYLYSLFLLSTMEGKMEGNSILYMVSAPIIYLGGEGFFFLHHPNILPIFSKIAYVDYCTSSA